MAPVAYLNVNRDGINIVSQPILFDSFHFSLLFCFYLPRKVDYSIKAHLEGVSMNTFGTADYAMKTSVRKTRYKLGIVPQITSTKAVMIVYHVL